MKGVGVKMGGVKSGGDTAGEGGKDHAGEVGWMGIGHGWETPS